MKKINCILLIDDSPDDNFFHERVIKKNNVASQVVTQLSASTALELLQPDHDHMVDPDLIFLDINMPGMNGWEFLNEYKQFAQSRNRTIIVMLTTSANPDDIKKAKELGIVTDFKTKPITKEMLEDIMNSYFPG